VKLWQIQFIVDAINKKSLLTEVMSNRPKVLVPEKVSQDGLALLRQTLDVHEKKGLSADEILNIIGRFISACEAHISSADRRLRRSDRSIGDQGH
jgi:hypothetical protein